MVTVNPAAARQNATARRPASGSAKPTTPLDRAKPAGASDDLLIVPFTVVYDRQERRGGWRFNGLYGDSSQKYRPLVVPIKEVHLKTGDYSIAGHEHLLTVERKSAEDFIGTLAAGRERFEREHERMAEMIAAGGWACVVVEGDMGRILDGLPDSGRKLSANSVLGSVESLTRNFGVNFYFPGSRAWAEKMAWQIIRKYHERLKDNERKQ